MSAYGQQLMRVGVFNVLLKHSQLPFFTPHECIYCQSIYVSIQR